MGKKVSDWQIEKEAKEGSYEEIAEDNKECMALVDEGESTVDECMDELQVKIEEDGLVETVGDISVEQVQGILKRVAQTAAQNVLDSCEEEDGKESTDDTDEESNETCSDLVQREMAAASLQDPESIDETDVKQTMIAGAVNEIVDLVSIEGADEDDLGDSETMDILEEEDVPATEIMKAFAVTLRKFKLNDTKPDNATKEEMMVARCGRHVQKERIQTCMELAQPNIEGDVNKIVLQECLNGTREEAERVKESANNISKIQKIKRGIASSRLQSEFAKKRERVQGLEDALSLKIKTCVYVSGADDEGGDDNADEITIPNVTKLTEARKLCREKFRAIREEVAKCEIEEEQMCCKAMTPECQACALGMTVEEFEEYCKDPEAKGCLRMQDDVVVVVGEDGFVDFMEEVELNSLMQESTIGVAACEDELECTV